MIGSVRAVAGAAVAAAIMAMATSAQAGFDVCNNSSDDVTVAFGYREDGEWTSSGWWNIDQGECMTVYDKTLKEQFYYYYAEKVNSDGYWEGDYVFCAIDEAFTIVGDQNCKSRGYDAYGFREVDVGERIDDSVELTD
jgi:uncharacterized membrane protein